MKIELYKSSSSYNVINKELTLLTTLTIHLKQGANLLHTQIIIHNNDQLKELNYAKMLNRSYYVQVQTLNNNKFLLLTLDEDVLETYKKDILNSSQDIIRKSTAGNIKQTNISTDTETETFKSNKGLDGKGYEIVLQTVGQPIKEA